MCKVFCGSGIPGFWRESASWVVPPDPEAYSQELRLSGCGTMGKLGSYKGRVPPGVASAQCNSNTSEISSFESAINVF